MERGHDGNAGAPGGPRRHQTQRGIQAAVHMHDVEPLLAKQRLEPGREAPAHGNPCDSSIRVNHEAGPNAPHVGMLQVLALVLHLGGHDGGGVTEAIQLPCEMVYVLRHAAELRIVVLRDERDAQRRHRGGTRSASRSTADTTAAGRSSWR